MAAGRGRKAGIILLVLVIAVLGLLVIADRVAAYEASRTIADQAQKEMAARDITSPEKPTVSVGGFPFLTQVASGRYHKVTIHAKDLTEQGVKIDTLDVVATGVNAKASALLRGSGKVTADQVTGTAALGWQAVTKLINTSASGIKGVTVSALPDGQIQMRAPVTMLGVSTTILATGILEISGTTVKVHITKVETQGGNAPAIFNSVLDTLKNQLSVTVKIPALPYGLKIKTVRPTQTGIAVTAVASNVPIAGGTT
jgi:hypothetical protein